PLVEYLASDGAALRGASSVLVPGCGSGHDVRALEAAGIHATGLDLSPTAVGFARSLPAAGREKYVSGSLFDTDWRSGLTFDAIWEHTCFCAIDPSDRPAYAWAAASILAPGGHLVGVFYLDPYEPGEDAAGPPWGATREEIAGLLAPWFDPVTDFVPHSAYPGREGREWLAVFRRRHEGGVAEGGRNG
ncbi:MAG: smtA, partial [Akkermansiaceae bacterium]|nr:smtA [Akkermansiaceae bacterium]